jgi:phosphatidylinositol 3,5-bisphosphate 5-phosphatase
VIFQNNFFKTLETKYIEYFSEFSMDAGDFFFSYGWDLTNSSQNQLSQKITVDSKSTSQQKMKLENQIINDRFVWNTHLLRPFLGAEPNLALILPIIHGYVGQRRIQIDDKILNIIIISRRSRFNAGPRYLKRGINASGDVANEVETEQILSQENDFDPRLTRIASFCYVKALS